jgi:hypothetical protein
MLFNIQKTLFISTGLINNTKQRSTVNARGTICNYLFQRGKEANMPKSWKFVTQNGAGLIHMKENKFCAVENTQDGRAAI